MTTLTGNNDTFAGGGGNDTVDGGGGDDSLSGGGGNDKLLGGTGDDTIDGGVGNDTINGGADNDVITGDEGADSLVGGGGNDCLDGGDDNDTLVGSAGQDTFLGGTGHDKLVGNGGGDRFIGGADGDVMTSDSATLATDVFVYTGVGDSAYSVGGTLPANNPAGALWDIIVNFQQGYDKLDFSAVALSGANAPTHLVWQGVTTTDADAGLANAERDYGIWYEVNRKFVYVDTNGDGAADMKIQGPTVLAAGDFIGVVDDNNINNDGMGVSTNDTIAGGAAAMAFGGAGDDQINLALLTCQAYCGSGNDTITGNSTLSNVIYAGSGSDVVTGDVKDDTIYGGSGNDTIDGQGGADLLF